MQDLKFLKITMVSGGGPDCGEDYYSFLYRGYICNYPGCGCKKTIINNSGYQAVNVTCGQGVAHTVAAGDVYACGPWPKANIEVKCLQFECDGTVGCVV